jgi:hypothetical protein
VSVHTQRRGDVEPPGMARLSRCGPAHGGVDVDVVDADVVYANEDTADSVKLTLQENWPVEALFGTRRDTCVAFT